MPQWIQSLNGKEWTWGVETPDETDAQRIASNLSSRYGVSIQVVPIYDRFKLVSYDGPQNIHDEYCDCSECAYKNGYADYDS